MIFIFLISFFFPPQLVCDIPLAWQVIHNIAVFVLGLCFRDERKHVAFALLNLATFT
jgi:hypothetical protein